MHPRGILTLTVLSLSAGAVFFAADVKLPPPYATPSANNGPHVIPQPAGAQLHVPAGFSVDVYAEGFARPRYMLLGPGGELLLSDAADSPDGTVYVMPLRKADGYKPGERRKLITGLDRPYGLAFWHEYLYVGERQSVKRYKYDAKAMTAGPGEEVVSLKGFSQGHWTRSLLFDRAGKKLYVGVGSASNVSTGENPLRAAINRYNPDGTGHETFASGTRNPIGLHWYPGTDTLWAAVQERDALGDDLVPDYFTHIQEGGFYGWPYAYIGPHEDPRNKGKAPDNLVSKTIVPDMPLMPAHQAVLDFAFYTARQFPAEYRGGAFLAMHGSWNRSQRVGYDVAFIPFRDGKPSGPEREFLTGWMIAPDNRDVWGRPVAVMILPDGSLLVSDDGGRKLWRVTYKH
ncbi:MAG TPA: PQQ-dependent sugar dehydrogenase [Bryobacteraceae bacterium]|nr:PQQ-dependent sugar dehydrogenase [Bryobacteraceae bacterium]